ncbi:ribonuclease E [Geomonas limicola]|uniref:Ribonuclease G n=1 Tax=Geomonas limicola TaxID=2740186 RepID=A0A6V8NAY7_9BACT|nr:Rne/Rng family ribonuclease [Geomonas limicola]GFO68389.1 ribonuclease E [Geomonas limicola]
MSRKMLINALHAEEARVAIVEDGRLVDLDIEIAGNEQIRGNIYKGVVVRVEPGLQAAFVDVGLKKLGFLQMGELHPENWKWREDIPEDQHRRPRIQEVLRRGQELVLQVEKGERDNKGSALTTYISLPGRYMVLMPGSDSAGISRKVEGEGERKKLKEIIAEMTIPEGYGYIIRTEAMGRTRDELQKDLDNLIALYEGVREKGAAMKGAGMIYQESALIIRTIRDYFSADIDEVLVDSKEVFKDVRDCLKEIDPKFEKLVKMHQEKRPIFSRYQLEEQIDLIYEKKVPLKSGGSIFIEPTEALVSIDVNSGKSTGEKGVEDTAFKTNLEAAEEAARQLRLRDLGGLIVIDFIDMRDRKHNAEVEKTLKSALKADKARVNVSRISEFGLLEMSRQRIRQTLNQASTLECPHCDGRGKVKSVEAMALSFLRKVHAAAAKGTIGEVIGSLPLEVAYYLLNRKRHELSQIESDYDIEVTVKGKPSYLLNQMELELVKREKLPQEELPERAMPRAAKEEAVQAEAGDGRKKKKKKGKAPAEPEAVLESSLETPPALEETLAAPEGAAEELEVLTSLEGEHEEHKKKRRRKRKRKGGAAESTPSTGEVTVESELALAAAEAVSAAEPAEPAGEGSETELHESALGEAHPEAKKKRRRKRRRGKGHDAAHDGAALPEHGALAESAAPAETVPAAGEEAAHDSGEGKAKKRPRRKKKAVGEASGSAAAAPAEAPAQPETVQPALAPAEAAPAKPARPRRTAKGAAEPAAEAAPAASQPAPAVEAGEPAAAAPAAKKRGGAQKGKAQKAAQDAAASEAPAPTAGAAAGSEEPKAEPAKKAKAPKAAKAPKTQKSQDAPQGVAAPAAPAAEAAPAPAEAPAAKKRPARTKAAAAAPQEPAAESSAGEPKAKKPRAPRKKKEENP